jgi:outer membrane receptor for ferrienterochelin and colicins
MNRIHLMWGIAMFHATSRASTGEAGPRALALWAAAVVVFACAVLAPAAGADEPVPADLTELSLEELMDVDVVVAASRHEQDPRIAPSSVSIITAEEIERYGCKTLADVLATVRGFYTSYDRNYQYVGVRGFLRPGDYGSRILILVDGYRINDPVYGQGPVGAEFPVDLSLAKRIEVVRGPGSSLYGTNALLAVVNVVTKTGADVSGAELSGMATGGRGAGGALTWGRGGGGRSLLVSGSVFDGDGRTLHFDEFDDPATNNGYADNDFERHGRSFVRATYGCFALEAAYSSRTKGIPTGAWGMVFNDERNRSVDEQLFVDLTWQRGVPETLAVLARAHHGRYTYDGDYAFGDSDTVLMNRDTAVGEWWGSELLLTKRLGGRHLATVGGEYQNNTRLDQDNFDVNTTYLESRESGQTWGLYAQDEAAITDELTLDAGFRYDHYGAFGGDWNPRLAVVYSPTDGTAIKLLYGGAFRAPSPYELYYHDGGLTQKSSPDLGPESLTSYEAALEQRLGKTLEISASVFEMTLDDLITQTTDPSDSLLVYRNMDRAESRGVEVGLERRAAHGWRGRLLYSYQDARDLSTDDRLTGSPRHLAKLLLTAPLVGDRLFGALEVQYVGDRPTVRGGTADAYAVVNVNFFADAVGDAWALSAGIRNVLDQKYSDPGSEEHIQDAIEQDGRTLSVGLSRYF